jgi:hypothetical protein
MNRFIIEYVTGFSMVDGPTVAAPPSSATSVRTAIDAMGLAAFQPGSDTDATPFSDPDWDVLDRTVQDSLSILTARLLAQEPGLIWKAGRTTTRAFPLFSYRVFYHLDGDDYDPIVVGLTFTVRGAEVRVVGDISGEESGFVYYDEGCTIDAPAEPLAVHDAARVVAGRLASQDSIVSNAIRNRHPRAVAR